MNKGNTNNFFHHPQKKHLIGGGIIWFIGVALLILATTDLFRESIFQTKNLVIGFMILASTGSMIKLCWNYYSTAKTANE